MTDRQTNIEGLRALLRWYAEMGVDEVVGPGPCDHFKKEAVTGPPQSAAADHGRLGHPLPPEQLAPIEKPAPTDKTDRAPGQSEAMSPADVAASSLTNAPANVPGNVPVSIIAPNKHPSADEAVAQAKQIAAQSTTIEQLREAVLGFDGCALKPGARNTVFGDGPEAADLLVIGEAPGRDEDRMGQPFVGPAGQLLDRMLATIGRDRLENVFISNVVFWRPPGNRPPTQTELAICKPFVDRLICLQKPKIIMLVGGAPTQALLGLSGIMRTRGTWRTIETVDGASIPTLPTLHPAFLLRQPAAKKLAWQDLLALQARLMDG